MEAYEVSYEIAGPILRNIREAYRRRDGYPLGSRGYIHYDTQIQQLIAHLDRVFRSTTPIVSEKYGQVHHSDAEDPFQWNQSTAEEKFDLAAEMKKAVPDGSNETDPTLKTPSKATRRASAEDETADLMSMFEKEGGKKSKSKKRRRMRIL